MNANADATAPGNPSENEDGVLEEAGVCVSVQNWSHRRRVWHALDELGDDEWECLLFVLAAVRDLNPRLRAIPPIIRLPTI